MAGFATSASAEFKPPLGLEWGEASDRIEKLLNGAKAKIVEKHDIDGRQRWTVEGLKQVGLCRTLFYFNARQLVEVDLRYGGPDWDTFKYDKFMTEVRTRIEQKFGVGQLIARSKWPEGDGTHTMVGYKWVQNNTAIHLTYYSTENTTQVYRTVSLQYTATPAASAFTLLPSDTESAPPIVTNKQTERSDPPRPNTSSIASGSGFFITNDGLIVTNFHVVGNAREIRVVRKDGVLRAKLILAVEANDLAVLKVEGHFTPLPVAPSRNVGAGAIVATVGFPNIALQGFKPKFAKGEIASLTGAGDDEHYFQISVPVQPGNSGSALVDECGNVVGIVSAKLEQAAALATSGVLAENVNYAIKSDDLLRFLEALPQAADGLSKPGTEKLSLEEIAARATEAAVLILAE